MRGHLLLCSSATLLAVATSCLLSGRVAAPATAPGAPGPQEAALERAAQALRRSPMHAAPRPAPRAAWPAPGKHARAVTAPRSGPVPTESSVAIAAATTPSAASAPPDGPVVVMHNGGPTGVTACGTALCSAGTPWLMDGATVYNPGLRPEQSGFLNPQGTIQLAQQAHLNTIRVINFYPNNGDPATEPYDATAWAEADQMIAAAGAAGMHVDLGLGDYRNTLWNDCINPYTYDWSPYVRWVASRRNTVTGATYGDDPTIAFVSVSGEPLAVGTHTFTARTTGNPCTITYTTQDLTNFYAATENAWAATGATVLINSGGLGYINEYQSAGIDWHAIYSLPHNALCAFKTYGGMLAFAPTVAAYCHAIGKPVIDEEFGYQQADGDAQRAAEMSSTYTEMVRIGAAGYAFWNLGYQVASTSYDIGPLTPLAFAALRAAGA